VDRISFPLAGGGREDEKLWLFEPLAHNLTREPGGGEIFIFFPAQPIEKSRFGKENENK
jgi:hypothetical protein